VAFSFGFLMGLITFKAFLNTGLNDALLIGRKRECCHYVDHGNDDHRLDQCKSQGLELFSG
jgi:hypothetical protein